MVIKTRLSSHGTQPLQTVAGSFLDDFQPPTKDEVRRLISTMPNKSSLVDCLPTSVMKSCSGVFAPLTAHQAKLSFSEGKFPSRYKTAYVTPLLKKKELDPDVASNERPIFNLHTISKLLERLFRARMRPHVEKLCKLQPLSVSVLGRSFNRNHASESPG